MTVKELLQTLVFKYLKGVVVAPADGGSRLHVYEEQHGKFLGFIALKNTELTVSSTFWTCIDLITAPEQEVYGTFKRVFHKYFKEQTT
jgi:hypothetical protein